DPVKEHDHGPDALRYCVMGIDRARQPHGMAPLPPAPEPKPPVDYERDYRVAPEKRPVERTRIKSVEEKDDESEEAKRLNREHLMENTFEGFSGFGGIEG